MSEILDTNNNYVLTTELHEEDIDLLRKKVEYLEKNLFKSQTQIKKLENQLKKSQDIISQNGKVTLK
jgi:chaperonin cofactor prefoldin